MTEEEMKEHGIISISMISEKSIDSVVYIKFFKGKQIRFNLPPGKMVTDEMLRYYIFKERTIKYRKKKIKSIVNNIM